MSKFRRGFTLVELTIVIAMIGLISGTVSKMWFSMEKMSKTSTQNIVFLEEGQRVLDRIERDIRQGIKCSKNQKVFLIIEQRTKDGRVRKIEYSIENNELLRKITSDNNSSQTVKIASLKRASLTITFLENGRVRLEWKKEKRNRPLALRINQLVSFVSPQD